MALSQLRLPRHVIPASELSTVPAHGPNWNLASLCGRLVELSGSAQAAPLTAAFGLVLDAQLSGDCAAWVTLEYSCFFPPDVADGGIDLQALAVVRVPDMRMAGRAADHLVRSGGFGLVVIDLLSEIAGESGQIHTGSGLPVPLLSRLLGLARQQNVAVLFLTKKSHEIPSLHSFISLRAEACRQKREEQYELSVRVLRDKLGGGIRPYREICRGPAGLR